MYSYGVELETLNKLLMVFYGLLQREPWRSHK